MTIKTTADRCPHNCGDMCFSDKTSVNGSPVKCKKDICPYLMKKQGVLK